MKAVIYTAPNTVEVVDKPIPQPEDGEVVVKVRPGERQSVQVRKLMVRHGRRSLPVDCGELVMNSIDQAGC